MNRAERVLEYIQKYGSITPLQAVRDLGYYRLSAAIHDIKQLGYNIKTETKTGKNRWGKSVHYAQYSLGDVNEV